MKARIVDCTCGVACVRHAGARRRLEFLSPSVRAAVRDLARRQAAERADREGHRRRAEGAPASLRHAADRAEQHHGRGGRRRRADRPTTCSTPATSRSPAFRACPGWCAPTRSSPRRPTRCGPIWRSRSPKRASTMLADYTYPLQVIWGKKKLTSLDDIKGMKLRVAQPEQGEMVRRFGGTSVTISAPEVPSALDRGVVDGIFTAGVGAVLWKDLLKFGYPDPGELEQLLHHRQHRSLQQALARPAGQAAQGRAGRREVESGHDAARRRPTR